MGAVYPAVPSVHVSYDVQYTVAVPAGQARGRVAVARQLAQVCSRWKVPH